MNVIANEQEYKMTQTHLLNLVSRRFLLITKVIT
jgi:hypothetical protein